MKLIRKLKLWIWKYRNNKQPQAEHLHQIILYSKKELKRQLFDFDYHKHLVACIVLGPEHPHYQVWLAFTCIKFELISSMSFPVGNRSFVKLPLKEYKKLFDGYLENIDEALDWLKRLERNSDLPVAVTTEDAQQLLKKYSAIKNSCVKMLASTLEVYYAYEYKAIIENIIFGYEMNANQAEGYDLYHWHD